ncbi:VOC family protein [Effusibacillus pohliae]|uniref:VOC family protein n=1 Tax=Effusibacillus pohliae TaxID=232270 RepID=UPI00036F7E4A|nr:VOC family protein [Effusibacillus pohliae]
MIQKVEHVGIMVSDAKRSIRFYENVIGLEVIKREKLNDRVELIFMGFPGQSDVQIELVAGTGETYPVKGVVNHVAFTVTDIEKEWERLKELNVELIDDEPRTILGGVKVGFFYGPDNERLEFFQPKE